MPAFSMSAWCSGANFSQNVDTSQFGQGKVPLTIDENDAAQLPNSATTNIQIDNSQPTVTFSGPTDVPSTAGPSIWPS